MRVGGTVRRGRIGLFGSICRFGSVQLVQLGVDPSRSAGLLAQVLNSLLHHLSRLEADDKFFRYLNLFARFGIPRGSSSSRFHLKDTKIPQFNSPLTDQRINDRIKRPLHDVFGLLLGQSEFLGDDSYDFFLRHPDLLPQSLNQRPPHDKQRKPLDVLDL